MESRNAEQFKSFQVFTHSQTRLDANGANNTNTNRNKGSVTGILSITLHYVFYFPSDYSFEPLFHFPGQGFLPGSYSHTHNFPPYRF